MATVSTINIEASSLNNLFDKPILDPEALQKASQVLQENHEIHHVFFHPLGLHNHIVHHILTELALGASPAAIERHYLNNKTYQQPQPPQQVAVIESLADPAEFLKHVGDKTQYLNFAEFFKHEIERQGVPAVVNRYLFEGDAVSQDMLERFFTLHPLIHMGCAVEFNQPALIVEALAQTATHNKTLGNFLTNAEKLALSQGKPNDRSLAEIIQAEYADERVRAVQSWTEPNRFANGPIQKAEKEVMSNAAQWNVGPGQMKEKMAELMNAAALVAGGAQRPPKIVKLDFFLIHGLTTSHSLMVFLEAPWISDENKVRMVEWMGRLEIAAYTAVGCPEIHLDEMTSYPPRCPQDHWPELIKRATAVEDDGHTSKVIRALIHGQQDSKDFEEQEQFLVKEDMWKTIAHMCLDSVENVEVRWVRIAGFPEAWEKFENRK